MAKPDALTVSWTSACWRQVHILCIRVDGRLCCFDLGILVGAPSLFLAHAMAELLRFHWLITPVKHLLRALNVGWPADVMVQGVQVLGSFKTDRSTHHELAALVKHFDGSVMTSFPKRCCHKSATASAEIDSHVTKATEVPHHPARQEQRLLVLADNLPIRVLELVCHGGTEEHIL